MRSLFTLFVVHALACLPALAQTKQVLKTISTNGITENLVVPSGKTLTIASGASIIAASGSTITGFGSGGGGSTAWGDITGTLADQTDLQSALNAKLAAATAASTYAPIASPTFTGTVTIPSGASISGYLTSATATSTYAPIASPTFTGTVTIPSGASISGYLTSATAATTYQPLATNLTSIGALANSAGVLTNNGSGTFSYTATSTGGNGASDDNKLVGYGTNGTLTATSSLTLNTGPATGGIFFWSNESAKGRLTASVSGLGTKTWTLPNVTGTIITTGDTGTVTNAMLAGSIDLTSKVTGTLPIANGGTGQTTATAAFDALSPSTTKGDIIVHNGTNEVRLPVGATNGHVLTVDSAESTGVKWAAASGGGGGLSNITETLNTSSPNATINAEVLAVTGGTTNTDLVLTPRGTGAFILGPVPDSTSTGGNKRGSRAVDLQLEHGAAARVASGTGSFAVGSNNTASSNYSAAIGYFVTASNVYASALGYNSTASGQASFTAGQNNTASGFAAATVGDTNTAAGYAAFAQGGAASARLAGMQAMSVYGTWGVGGAQGIRVLQTISTTNATPTEMFGNYNQAERYTIPSGNTHFVRVYITGASSTNTASYARQVCIRNTAGTTSLVGSVQTIGTDQETDAAWDVSITANDTNDALKIEVTGAAATTIRWVALIDGTELKNP